MEVCFTKLRKDFVNAGKIHAKAKMRKTKRCSTWQKNQQPQFLPNVEQRLGFMHLYITDGTVFAGFQVAHNAHLADCTP